VRALVVALALLVVVPGIRAAEPPKDVATAHVRKATAAYNLGKYADAAKEYEAAYEQTLDPNLLFNIAQAYRLAGDREKAITAYRSFIRSAPQSEQRHLAETKVRELERQRSTAPPATGPVPAPESAASAPAAAPAPTPALRPMAPVVPASTDTPGPGSAAAATPSTTEVAGGLVTAPSAPEPAQPARFYKRWPFWTAVGAVVAGGVVLGIVLSRHSNDVTMPPSKYGTQEF
jgi:tetratricopeptide (TPR) repeat protein